MADGDVLLIFDGLDEVPADSRRAVREAIVSVTHPLITQVIVTCRTRSYTAEAHLAQLATFTLAPFDEEKISQFAAAWYILQRTWGRLDEAQAKAKTADLQRAATDKLSAPPRRKPAFADHDGHDSPAGQRAVPKQRVLLYERE